MIICPINQNLTCMLDCSSEERVANSYSIILKLSQRGIQFVVANKDFEELKSLDILRNYIFKQFITQLGAQK